MLLDFVNKYPFVLAFILGLVPALVWVWFWLKEDEHPEPAKNLTLSFLGGMLAVLIVLPIEKLIYFSVGDSGKLSFFLWASTEEIFKFLTVYFIALRWKKITDEPVDDMIYLIISALGFVTFENTLFLIPLVNSGDLAETILNGNLRFIGASLLHVISSATIGVFMALSFYKPKFEKITNTITGILVAIVLHTIFNLFIISGAPGDIYFIFGSVWIGIVILMLFFEKVKHMRRVINSQT